MTFTDDEALDNVSKVKKYVKNGVARPEYITYFEPIVEKLRDVPGKWDIRVSHSSENENTDGTRNVTYGKMLLEKKLEDYNIGSDFPTIGYVVSLNDAVQKFAPYAGYKVAACTNLMIMSDMHCTVINDNHNAAKGELFTYADGLQQNFENYSRFMQKLQGLHVDIESIDRGMGYFARRRLTDQRYSPIELSSISKAQQYLFEDRNSGYYIEGDDDEKTTTPWNILGALTQTVTDKFSKKGGDPGFISRPMKTLRIGELVEEMVDKGIFN